MDTTVIMSSYNQPKSMALGLYALTLQNDLDFELIVADDGSEPEVGGMVAKFAATAPFSVRFITQVDDGFRKPTILNKAAIAAAGQKLIFIDGDCIPFQNHIRLHKANLAPGRFCVGGRVMLSPEDSLALTMEDIKLEQHARFLTEEATRHLVKKERTSRLQGLLGMRRSPRIIGCNFSVMKTDLYKVNGFDETLNGIGKEDSDLRNRLRNNGCKGSSLFTRNIVCHLDHSLDRKSQTAANKRHVDKGYYKTRIKALTAACGLKELECRQD